MPRKILYHYLPTSGVRADFKRLMNEFISAKTVRYEHFSEIWRKRKFSFLCAGRHSERETREFLERALLIAVEFFLPPYQFQVRVGGLYLLYGIFMTQPILPRAKVRLTLSQWKATICLQQEASQQNHLDVVYIFNKMLEEQAFHFCYTHSEMNERTLNPEREDHEINLADDLKEERREINRLFDYESMEQLSYLLDHYHRMKINNAGPRATRPDKSLDVVQSSMVEDLVLMLQSFKESVSNIYKHGSAKVVLPEETGPSEVGQSILNKRLSIKSKIYSGMDVPSPEKKTIISEESSSSHKAQMVTKIIKSPKESPLKFEVGEEDALESFVSPTGTRQRGRPKKLTAPKGYVSQKNLAEENVQVNVEDRQPSLHNSSNWSDEKPDVVNESVDSVMQISFDSLFSVSVPTKKGKQTINTKETGATMSKKVATAKTLTSPLPKRLSSRNIRKTEKFSPTSSPGNEQKNKVSPKKSSSHATKKKKSASEHINSDDDEDIDNTGALSKNICTLEGEKNKNTSIPKRRGRPPADRKKMVLSENKNLKSQSKAVKAKVIYNKKLPRHKLMKKKVVVSMSGLTTASERDRDISSDTEEVAPATNTVLGNKLSEPTSSSRDLDFSMQSPKVPLSCTNAFIHKNNEEKSKKKNISSTSNDSSDSYGSEVESSPKQAGLQRQTREIQKRVSILVDSSSGKQLKTQGKNSNNALDHSTHSDSDKKISAASTHGKEIDNPQNSGTKPMEIVRRGRGRPRKVIKTDSTLITPDSRKRLKSGDEMSPVKRAKVEFRERFKNILDGSGTSPKFLPWSESAAIAGKEEGKTECVVMPKPALSTILGGNSAEQCIKKPIKVIKIVTKGKAEAQEILKSIEKQRASGDKLLSNLPSDCVKTISVGTKLSINKSKSEQASNKPDFSGFTAKRYI